MKDYVDSRIVLPVPEKWRVWNDESDNIFYQDPAEDSAWCFVQFSGIRPKDDGTSLPSPREFLKECYGSELVAGEAQLTQLPANRALVEWIEDAIHEGEDFAIYHCHIAQRSQAGHLQLVDLAASVPRAIADEIGGRYKEMLRLQAGEVRFKEWDDDSDLPERKHNQTPHADIYIDMRNRALTVKPEEIGLSPSADFTVWGVLMEFTLPDGVVTLVALGDGTVSLYFSNGGGRIGVGQHEVPRRISKELIALASQFTKHTSPSSAFPPPDEGCTRFYFLTFDGARTFQAPDADLANDLSALSPIFQKCHELIGATREIEGSRDA